MRVGDTVSFIGEVVGTHFDNGIEYVRLKSGCADYQEVTVLIPASWLELIKPSPPSERSGYTSPETGYMSPPTTGGEHGDTSD